MTARKYYTHVTNENDTFDKLALDFYGEEKYSIFIMQMNPKHMGTIQFEYGVELMIPILEDKNTSSLPPWKSR